MFPVKNKPQALYTPYEAMSKAGSEDARAGYEQMRERFAHRQALTG